MVHWYNISTYISDNLVYLFNILLGMVSCNFHQKKYGKVYLTRNHVYASDHVL